MAYLTKVVFKTMLFSLVLSTLLYPGLDKFYLYREAIKFEDLVMAPLEFLGENQVILSDLDRFSRYNTKYKSLELLRGNNLAIGIKNEFNFHEKWGNLTKERERVYKERRQDISESYANLLNKTYSMMLFGPPVTSGDLSFLIGEAGLGNPGYAEKQGFCTLILFSAEQKCNDCQFMLAVILDKEHCEKSIDKLNRYYNDNFDKFCQFDKSLTNDYFRNQLAIEGFRNYLTIDGKTSAECKGGGSLLGEYVNKSFRLRSLLNLVYLSVIIFLLLNFNKIKNYFKKPQSI